MRPLVALLFALALPGSAFLPHLARAQDATAICTPIFGGETAAIMVAFDNLRIDRLEGCNAFKFLLERNGTGTKGVPGCYRTQNDRIIKLSPAFAVGLYRSLSEIERVHGGKNIIQSGYRCDNTGSHPRGCAADIIWASCSQKFPGNTGQAWRCSSDSFEAPEQKWIDANGKSDRYKIHLRLRYAPEGHHVEPLNMQGCNTGPTVGAPPGTPTSGFANQLRQALGMQQQPTPMPQPTPTQPIQQQQSPLGAFNQPLPQPTQLPVSEDLGSKPLPTPDKSIADILRDIASGTTTTTTSTSTAATTAPIVITAESAGTIVSVTHSSATPQYGSGSLQPVGQQTFTSSNEGQTPAAPSNTQRILQLYQQLLGALRKMLEILRPFGSGRGSASATPDTHAHSDEYWY